MLKPKYLLLYSLIILASCQDGDIPKEPELEEPVKCILDGTYILINDSVNITFESVDSLLIEELSFFKDHCTFTTDSVSYRGNYGCVDPYIWVAVEGFDTLRLEQISTDELYGQGLVQGRYLLKGSDLFKDALAALEPVTTQKDPEEKKVHETVQKEVTKAETNNTKVTTDNTPPTPNSTGLKAATISFGDNLSGNTYRVRLYEPYAGGIKSNENAKVYLMLTVDAQGNVMKAENNVEKTTSKNSQLVNDIIALAKKIKYNKEPGANLAKVPLMVSVNVN